MIKCCALNEVFLSVCGGLALEELPIPDHTHLPLLPVVIEMTPLGVHTHPCTPGIHTPHTHTHTIPGIL